MSERRGQWVAVASLVVAVLTLLIALPGAINDWTTLRTPHPTPTRSTASATPTEAPTSPSSRPTNSQPPKPAEDDGSWNLLDRINTFRGELGGRGLVAVVALGAVVIFVCAGVCRFVIITSYWRIGVPTWAVLIGIPLFVWPSVSGHGIGALILLGVGYFVTACVIAWIAKAIADP